MTARTAKPAKPAKKAAPGKAQGAPRPRVTPWWRRRGTRAGVALTVAGGLVLGVWWTWHRGWGPALIAETHTRMIALSAEAGLTVKDVLVEGRRETPKARLLAALGVERGTPILTFDPHAARRRVEALPWVRSAAIERLLPDTVLLRLEERSPLALWQRDGSFTLIDDAGEVIPDASPHRFGDLVVVIGDDAPRHAAGLLELLGQAPALMSRVKAAVRIGGRRWNLVLDNGIDVQLPEQAPTQAWQRLAEYEKSHKVLDKDVEAVDLRLPDRLVLRRGRPTSRVPEKRGRKT